MTTSNILSILVATLLLTPTSPFAVNRASPPISSLWAAASDDNSLPASALNKPPISNELSNDVVNEIPELLSSTTNFNGNSAANKKIDTHGTHSCEFNLEPQTTSPLRQERLDLESRLKSIYTPAGSDAYWELRDEILQLESDLEVARSVLGGRGEAGVKAIETMLRRKQAKDPEHVYRVTTAAARVARRMGRVEEAERYQMESLRAKKMLPQFNLEGLWVGK